MNEEIYETEIIDNDIEEVEETGHGGLIALGVAAVAGLAVAGVVGVKKFIEKRRNGYVDVEDKTVEEVETKEDSKDDE